jgi:hypothetical protein
MRTYLVSLSEHLLSSSLKFLSLPIVFADALFTDFRLEWLKLDQSLAAGTAHGTGLLLPFLKWAALSALGIIAVIFILLATIWSIVFHDIDKKTPGGIFGDVIILAMVLFLYYFLFASAVYFFFYIALPVQ